MLIHISYLVLYFQFEYFSGQNLFQGSPAGSYSWPKIIQAWWKEKKDYNLRTMRPRSNKVVGHFTQIAWANTNKIGCGWAACNGGRKTIAVCNYSPQ